jgi:hypothetical protein
MKDFVKDYIFSSITPTPSIKEINILEETKKKSFAYDERYLKCGDYIILYKEHPVLTGMIFYIYNSSFQLVAEKHLDGTPWISIEGNSLKQDEDGKFYAIGQVTPNPSSSQTSYYSLILLNDIINEEPTVRKWYKLSDIGITNIGISADSVAVCQKRNGSADYIFIYDGIRTDSTYTYYDLRFVQFTINIQNGNSYNTWVYEGYSRKVNGGPLEMFADIGFQYNQNTSKFLITRMKNDNMVVFLINLENNWQEGEISYLSNENGVEVSKIIYEDIVPTTIVKANGISNIVFINNRGTKIIQYNVADNFNTPISKELPKQTLDNIFNESYIGLIVNENDSYKLYIYSYELTNNSINISNKYIKSNTDFDDGFISAINLFNINSYNLTNIGFIYSRTYENKSLVVIATDNSTLEYINYNTLVPDYINLKDDNNNYVFSRKITNKTIIGNQMSAEINVPYSMLNDVQISTEELIGETNKAIITENTIINKNIYESLYLNYINHINVIDNNFKKKDLQDNISAFLVESIFTDKAQTNYQLAPIGYIKEFKINGQTKIKQFPRDAIVQVNPYEYKINLAVNGTEVNQIQILAKDQQTPYITIPLYSTNKPVRIQQTLKFE